MDQIRSLERKLEHNEDVGLGRSDRLHGKAAKLQQELQEMTDKYMNMLDTFESTERTLILTQKEKDRQHQL